MADTVEQKEWAEGLRENASKAYPYSSVSMLTDDVVALADAVISLTGEVERLRETVERVARSGCDDYGDCRFRPVENRCSACQARAALSPLLSERKGP